jgi:hypothetical protein
VKNPWSLASVLATGVFLFSLCLESAWAYHFDPRCNVFQSAQDRAGCRCALRLGGWVTEVQGRWRWIYPRRHQERYCHGQVRSDRAPLQ